VARGIAELLPKIELVVYALAVQPDHVHVVAAQHAYSPEEILAALKRAGTKGLSADSLHPFTNHPRTNDRLPSPWAEKGWKVFLNTPEEMRRAIRYVEQNPIRAGLKPQSWSCVTRYAL
jgi:REP element-mobilizing transposase RayT